MRIFGVGNVVELAGEILPPWTVEADGRIIAYCPEEADARAIVDACNAAERATDGWGVWSKMDVDIEAEPLSPRGHAVMEDS